jgi:hypothetical protein
MLQRGAAVARATIAFRFRAPRNGRDARVVRIEVPIRARTKHRGEDLPRDRSGRRRDVGTRLNGAVNAV